MKSNTNNIDWNILVTLNNGSVWLLNFALLMSELHVSEVTLYDVIFSHYNFPMPIFHNIYEIVPVKNTELSSSHLVICFTCLIENKALDTNMGGEIFPTKIFIYEDVQIFYWFFLFIPVKLHCCWRGLITIYLVFVAFRDNLFPQTNGTIC